jgi:predicted permease
VVLINETAARQFWPGEDPVGRHISLGIGFFREGETAEIVGVVGDVKYNAVHEPVKPDAYVSDLQYAYPSTRFLVRTAGDPLALVSAVRREVLAMDPDLPIADVQTMETRTAAAMSKTRFSALLLSVFSAIAMVLAALGVYGVMAYGVTQRRREIGVRMALGAQRRDVLGLVVRQGLGVALVGVAAGLAAAFGLTRLLGALLHGVSATDPATFAGVALLLLAVALLASFIPARRAAKVDPMVALRHE